MRSLGLLIVALAIVGVGWWFFPSETRRVQQASLALAETISVPAGEPDMARLSRLARLSPQLDPGVIVGADGVDATLEGRDAVVGFVGRVLSPRGLTVTLDDLHIAIDTSSVPRMATVTTRAIAREPGAEGTGESIEIRRVTLDWAKSDEGWRLTRATIGPAPDGPRVP